MVQGKLQDEAKDEDATQFSWLQLESDSSVQTQEGRPQAEADEKESMIFK